MKILVLSDIHANWHALQAVLAKESYDALIFLGDVVDFGPDPKNCIKFLINSSKKRFWGVRGDHDHAMAYGMNSNCTEELNKLSTITRDCGEGFLGRFLRRLPIERHFSLDGMEFELAHDSDPFAYKPCRCKYESDETHPVKEPGRKFILTGHSHKPFIKNLGEKIILNPGSVGHPRDSDPRASYAVIENGEAFIGRVSYDIDKTAKDPEKSTLPYEVKGRLISMLFSGAVVNLITTSAVYLYIRFTFLPPDFTI